MALTITWTIEEGQSEAGEGLVPIALLADITAHDGVTIEVSSSSGRVWYITPTIAVHRIPLSKLGVVGVSHASQITGLKYRALGSIRQVISFGGSSANVVVPCCLMTMSVFPPGVSGGAAP